jgi:type I restriction enzyme S subunit
VQFEFPDENGNPYKSSGGKMVYNQTLKREIPEGWEVKRLGKVLKTSLGGTPSTKEFSYWEGANIHWLNSGEISNFPVISSEDYITQEGINNSAAELLPKGTVVISIVRYIRPSILAIDAATNQSVVGIYESSKLKHSFIYPLLVNDVPRLMSLRTGAQQPHINKGVVDSILIIVPCEDILRQYYCVAMPIYRKLMTIAFENQQLTQLRDWLLPMLMNGQVTIK